MALSCPNINLQEWKDLVAQLGDEDLAYFQWNKNSSEISPEQSRYASLMRDIVERRQLASKEDLNSSQLIRDIRVDKSQPKDIKPNKADKNLASIMLYGKSYDQLLQSAEPEKAGDAEVLAYRILNDLMFDLSEVQEFYDIVKEDPKYLASLTTNENPVKDFFEGDLYDLTDKAATSKLAQQLDSQYSALPSESIKKGVQELFESNPELANAVYEALEFKTNSLQAFKDNLINIIGVDKVKELYAGTDVEFNSFTIDDVELGTDKSLIVTIKTDKGQRTAINLRLDGDYQYLKISEGNKTVKGIYAPLSEKKTAIDFLINEFKNLNIQEATPQQKQQAQQLYSQYLDTIFPDSKVKDIVYHGTEQYGFEKFDINAKSKRSLIGKLTKTKGIFFTNDIEVAKDYAGIDERFNIKRGDIYKVILNIKNYNTNPKNIDFLTEKEQIGFDSAIDRGQYVVFDPEQIHILGSKQDIEGFKRFVSGSSTKLAQRPMLDGDYVTRLRKVAGQWNMSETGFIKTLGSKQELMRDVENQALSGIEVATASNGSFYFKMNGKKINPFKLKTQASRQKQVKTDKRIVGELRNHLMDFLKTLGVNVQEVDISKLDEGNIAEAEVIVKASGVVEKIIRIAKGYEKQDTLAEEAAHIIVDMLGENNPQVREMLELITETQLFKDVIEAYSDLYDGDAMMLKKEAVGQMIAAYLTGNDDVKRQVSPTLWDKVISFFEWLFGAAKTYDETVFRQRLDKVFQPLVDQILAGSTKGLSDENIKQSTTLAQRGEAGVRDVKTRNEQSFSERVVADLKNQIERLNRQRRPGADNSAIRAEITKLRGRLLSYSITPDLGFLLAYAKEDLAQLQALRAKFDEMTPDEKSRFFLFANYYINSWATLGEAVDITDTNIADPAQDDLRKQFTEIVGNASLMQAELLELFKDHYAKINQIEDGGQFNLFGDYANTNFFESQFLNISVSKIPLVRKIYDIVQKANYQAAERTKMAKEEIEAQVTQLKKWAKANGISEKDLWDIFKQKDSKGNWTGNYIHEYDQRYYEERSRKYRERFEYERGTPEYQRAIREYNKWVEQNSNTIIEEAKYQEAYEAAKQHYTDENGNLEEGMLNYWENLYSPHKKGDMRFEFVTILPKAEKWGDARFDKIKNTPQLLEFYNFFTEFLNERKKVLPYADALKKPNYLPEMYRKGMEGGIRLGSLVKGIGSSVLSTFTARIKPSKQRLTEDPQTGMAENTIPLYMLNDSLNPNNKEYDLEQVLKNFAAMSYLYEHREQVEPDVLVLRKLFADIRNPESQMDSNGRAPYSSITGRFFENRGETRHSNTLAALDYFIEASLYDNKAADPDASSSLAYETVNPKTGRPEVRGFSFTKFVEFLIKWTRRRGMGFNSFAASANLFFGVLSNQIEAASGTHFTTDQANMAFRKMLGVALGGKLTEEGKKILLLMEKFDVVKDYMDTSSEGTFSPSKFDKLLFIMQEKTENFIYGQTFLAVLFNTKIKDKSGKERHLFDAYEVKDGKLAWKEEFGHEEFEDLSDEKYRLKTKVDRLLEDIHGDYNSLNPKLINKTVLGRAVMVFRNWIPQGVQNRFGSLRYDSRLGTQKKGRLLSYGAYFQKNDRDQRDFGRGIADLLRDTSMELAKQTINSFFLGKKIVNYDTMSQLSELDAANMRKNITALRFTLMLMAVALLIKGLTIDDDDDKQVSAIKFILMSIYRTETDLTFYLNPNSQQQLLRDFVPVAGTIGEITDIFDATMQLVAGNDELQSGPNAGRSRFMREAYQSLPALAQIQRLYELQGINIDSRRGY